MAQEGLRTHRGHLLIGTPLDKPVLTVELYVKWYELWLIHPNGKLESIEFSQLDDGGGTPYVDHVPNPKHVRALEERNDWHLNELAEDLITGRWQLEVVEPLPRRD